MATVVKKTVSKNNSKTYASKDFDALRADLVTYARNYFSDQIKDFSEPSLGGMFVELAAYVGDTLNYYLDHQFNELNPSTAIETRNIENHALRGRVPDRYLLRGVLVGELVGTEGTPSRSDASK